MQGVRLITRAHVHKSAECVESHVLFVHNISFLEIQITECIRKRHGKNPMNLNVDK